MLPRLLYLQVQALQGTLTPSQPAPRCQDSVLLGARGPPLPSAVPLHPGQHGKPGLGLQPGFSLSEAPGAEPQQVEEQHVWSGPSSPAADECFMRRRARTRSLLLLWATQSRRRADTQRHLCAPAHQLAITQHTCVVEGRADLLGPSALISSGFNIWKLHVYGRTRLLTWQRQGRQTRARCSFGMGGKAQGRAVAPPA